MSNNMEFIYEGGYGKVYNKSNDTVVKITDKYSSLKFKHKFCKQNLHELVFLKMYKHVNIGELKNVVIKPETYELELIKYEITLHDYIIKTDINTRIDNFYNIFYQLVSGLYFIHINGLIHGDFKPKNIMYNTITKNIRIIDFGGITSFRMTKANMCLCTMAFSPPEGWDVLKKNTHDNKFDIWSLAATMIYYLTEVYIFDVTEEEDAIYIKKIKELMIDTKYAPIPATSNNVMDDATRNMLKRMLQYDPEYRISITNLYNHSYFNICRTQNIEPIIPLNIEPIFDTNYFTSLSFNNINNRKKMINWIYKICIINKVLECFVLTVTLIDIYCQIKPVKINSKNYKKIASSMLILVSNLILESSLKFSIMKKSIGKYYKEIINNKSMDILNILDYKLYYNTFDWDLYKRDIAIDYFKIKKIISNISNIGLSNQELISLV
jgi:serine/threonine protein kinase